MLRIISVLLLLIISQISFASVSTNNSIVSATATTNYSVIVYKISTQSINYSTAEASCRAYVASLSLATPSHTFLYTSSSSGSYNVSFGRCNYTNDGASTNVPIYLYKTTVTTYSCSSGVLSDSSGVPSSSGQFCNTTTTVDSCASYAGQSGYFWVNKVNPPSTICSGTCLASSGVVAGFPDADPLSWIYLRYTYTGETSGCSSDSGFTDEANAAASNSAAAERERLAKIQKAIDDAIASCGGVGFYTTGSFNGSTVVSCTNQDKKTNSTTTTTTSGATSTTTDTSTTTSNNGKTTTVNSDGTSTTTGSTTTSSSKTSTTTTKTNPDGSTTTTTTEEGDTGACDSSDMSGTVGCAEMGEVPEADDIPSSEEDSGLGSYTPWGSSSSGCPAPPVVNGHIIDNSDQCTFFSKLKPFIIAAGFLIAVYISLGIRSSGGD